MHLVKSKKKIVEVNSLENLKESYKILSREQSQDSMELIKYVEEGTMKPSLDNYEE